jgi:hypothetical protein
MRKYSMILKQCEEQLNPVLSRERRNWESPPPIPLGEGDIDLRRGDTSFEGTTGALERCVEEREKKVRFASPGTS